MKQRKHLHLPAFEELRPDLSPLIDLVFLLLIFFMTSSTIITYLKDRRVALPVAEAARPPRDLRGRVVVNVYADGSLGDERGRPITAEGAARLLRAASEAGPGTRLQVRADRTVAHGAVKGVLAAARRAGVHEVMFSTFTAER